MAGGHKAVAAQGQGAIVVVARGQGAHFAFQVGVVHHDAGVPYAGEKERAAVGLPDEAVHAGFEALRYVSLFTAFQIEDAEARAVALVAVAGHAEPSHVAAVGRIGGIGVVAHVAVLRLVVHGLVLHGARGVDGWFLISGGFAEVVGLAALRVVAVDVAVGADGIVAPRLLAAGVYDVPPVGAPVELFASAEGEHGAFEGFALQNVLAFADASVRHFGQENVRDGFHVVVPVLEVQVGDDHAAGQRQVVVRLLDGGVGVDGMHEDDFLPVGRELVAFHVLVAEAQLASCRAVERHLPDLVATGAVAQKSEAVAVGREGRLGFVVGCRGEHCALRPVGVHQVDDGVAFVLLHAVIAHGVGYFLGIGRHGEASDAAHGP